MMWLTLFIASYGYYPVLDIFLCGTSFQICIYLKYTAFLKMHSDKLLEYQEVCISKLQLNQNITWPLPWPHGLLLKPTM